LSDGDFSLTDPEKVFDLQIYFPKWGGGPYKIIEVENIEKIDMENIFPKTLKIF
jgi:hypothetical protein